MERSPRSMAQVKRERCFKKGPCQRNLKNAAAAQTHAAENGTEKKAAKLCVDRQNLQLELPASQASHCMASCPCTTAGSEVGRLFT